MVFAERERDKPGRDKAGPESPSRQPRARRPPQGATLDTAPPETEGQVGPHALIGLAEVLLERDGTAARLRVFRGAGLARHLTAPPAGMVEERDVARLFAVLHDEFGAREAAERLTAAGGRAAAALLAHRIPAFARVLLPNMPASFAAVLLTRSIQRHGWTLLGSGELCVVAGNPLGIRIRLAPALLPVARLAGEFHRATFEGLFRALVHDEARAVAARAGAGDCRFDIML